MITPVDPSQLHLVRGGFAANAPRVQPDPALHTDAAAEGARLAEDIHKIVADAYKCGLEHGEPQHYSAGWRFGLLCGLLPGMLSGAGLAALIILRLA